MNIDSLAAQEVAATDHAPANISSNEIRPDGMVIAWSHYAFVVEN